MYSNSVPQSEFGNTLALLGPKKFLGLNIELYPDSWMFLELFEMLFGNTFLSLCLNISVVLDFRNEPEDYPIDS